MINPSKLNPHKLTIDPLAKRAALIFFILFQIFRVGAQTTADSIPQRDTVNPKLLLGDSSMSRVVIHQTPKIHVDTPVVYHTDSLRYSERKPTDFTPLPGTMPGLLAAHPYFNFSGKPLHLRAERYEPVSYDGMFYLILAILFYFALVRLFFAKYMANLMTLFFKASIRQHQLREQVLQSPFPSLLLNNLFVFSGGLYGAFLLRYYHFGNQDRFWVNFLYCAGILTLLYLLKYIILRLTGWIFNINRAVEAYLFVVFLTNKIIGIFLLPFLVLIAFSGPLVTEIGITLSFLLIGLFYIYRFIASYSTLHKEIKISGLHFFLYLCAFEIAPLLLIYKVLVTYLEKAY